jgi:hypothetical protein
MSTRTIAVALAAVVVAAAAAAPSDSSAAGTTTFFLRNENGASAVFSGAANLSAGSTEIVLARGTASRALLAWTQPADVTILMMDASGTPVARYHIENAWPKKWTGIGLDAGKNEIAIESLMIQTEGLR